MRGTWLFNVVLVILVGVSQTTSAQEAAPSRTVAGTVVDATGGAVVGASVTLHVITGERRAVTDSEGRFAFSGIPPGRATVTVRFPQFTPVVVSLQSEDLLRIVLRPAGLAETVTVGGSELRTSGISSATKTHTPLREVPQSMSVVTRDLIADQRMQSIADVVRFMPGVGMAQGEGNRDAPILRGNTSTSDFFVDGVRDDVQYLRDLYNVERVEALKGPNALMFGRGGVGGVINRVSRQASWGAPREVSLQIGSWNDRRLTGDVGAAMTDRLASRVTGVYQHVDSYRNGVRLERYGMNPTLAFALTPNTTVRAGYEYFHDSRTADRGISSFGGRPVDVDRSTFFGNPELSPTTATVNVLTAVLDHTFGRATLKNRVSYGDYDKFYQNVFPGAVNAAGTEVSISAYHQGTQRANLFNQTDVIVPTRTGPISHIVLAGVEFGRQVTDNRRETGFFTTLGPNITSISLPLANPTTSLPVEFRQNATDADNHGIATTAAVYAQDQVTLSRLVKAVVGIRLDQFDVDFRNNRTATDLATRDRLLSPRAGLIVTPTEAMSLYASYSLSYLPRAGEQLASLSATNEALEPEQFRNVELGVKWDLAPTLALTAAVYHLNRSNVAVPDPVDTTRLLLVDGQRTKGVELELTGRITPQWQITAGYAYQDGQLTATASSTARSGASLAMVPEHSFSLWNKYDVSRRWSVGLGVIRRGDSFTSTDNTVVLPAFTRADGAVFFNISEAVGAQMNIENLFDANYYPWAHNNTNITPGAPRSLRVSLTTRF